MSTMKEAKAIKLDCTFVVNIPTDNLPKMAVEMVEYRSVFFLRLL